MLNSRNSTLKRQAFERDNFTCQKCKIVDKSSKTLEAHHIVPLFDRGEDNLDNLITLCSDCHHFAPNKKEDFLEYLKEECNGTITTLIKSMNKVRNDHPEFFN